MVRCTCLVEYRIIVQREYARRSVIDRGEIDSTDRDTRAERQFAILLVRRSGRVRAGITIVCHSGVANRTFSRDGLCRFTKTNGQTGDHGTDDYDGQDDIADDFHLYFTFPPVERPELICLLIGILNSYLLV